MPDLLPPAPSSIRAFRSREIVFLACLAIAFIAMMLAPVLAFAQVGAPGPMPPPTLTAPVAVVLVLSLLLGFVTQMVQTGSIFGLKTTPQDWLPGLTVLMTFLGGVVAYFAGLGAAFEVNVTTVVYGLAAGVAALLTGSAPGIANHAHVVVPANVLELRAKAAARVLGKAAVALLALGLLGATQSACISDGAIVPVTPGNQSQVSTCQNTATEHNGFVLAGIVSGAAATGLGTTSAIVPGSNASLQTGLAIGAAGAALVTTVAAGGAGLTAASFTNSQCSSVVGPLPLKADPPAPVAILPAFSAMGETTVTVSKVSQ